MAKRLKIQAARGPAVAVARPALRSQKLVYIGVANKKIRYAKGSSRIVYIGTTQNGVRRIASSAAFHASSILEYHGIKSLGFFVVTCDSRPNVQTWRKLERGLLLAFKDEFGEPPLGNKQGKNYFWKDEWRYFHHRRLRNVIQYYSG